LHPHEDDDGADAIDPLDLEKTAKDAFREADQTKDGYITFLDFVHWMREHIEHLELTNDELEQLFEQLAQILQSVFLEVRKADKPSKSFDMTKLEKLLEELANTTREFNDALKGDDTECSNTWSEPPTGLNIERLKGTHMKLYPINMRSAKKVDFQILCIPVVPVEPVDSEERVWLGVIVRTIVYKSEKKVVQAPDYYGYEKETFRWVPIDNTEGKEVFESALKKLPVEIALFCLLKTQANFGSELDWKQVTSAMRTALNFGFLTHDDLRMYTRHMETVAIKSIHGSDTIFTPESVEDKQHEALLEHLEQRPRVVMATLSKLGIVKLNPLWADFIPIS
jgi:hypothetical protein